MGRGMEGEGSAADGRGGVQAARFGKGGTVRRGGDTVAESGRLDSANPLHATCTV